MASEINRRQALTAGLAGVAAAALAGSAAGPAHAASAEALPGPASARRLNQAYYVSASTGNDANAGTSPSAPWRTLDRIRTTVFQPGDTIHLLRGDTWTPSLPTDLRGSGTAAAPITLTEYGSASTPPTIAYGDGKVFVITNESNWIVERLRIQLTTTESVLTGDYYKNVGVYVQITPAAAALPIENITIRNMEISGQHFNRNCAGIMVGAHSFPGTVTTTLVRNVTITENTIHDYGMAAIDVSGWDVTMVSPQIFENTQITHNAVWNGAGNGIVMRTAHDSLASYNHVHHAGQYVGTGFIWGMSSLWGYGLSNTVIEHNETSYMGDSSSGLDGSGIDVDWNCDNVEVRYNYVHHNYGPGIETMSCTNVSIHDNRVEHNRCLTDRLPAQITLTDYNGNPLPSSPVLTSVEVHNNTIVVSEPNTAGFGTTTFHPGAGVWNSNRFENNSIETRGSATGMRQYALAAGTLMDVVNANILDLGGKPFSSDAYGTTYGTFGAWQSGTGYDASTTVIP